MNTPRKAHIRVAISLMESVLDILPGEENTRPVNLNKALHRIMLAGGELPETVSDLLKSGKTHTMLVAIALRDLKQFSATLN